MTVSELELLAKHTVLQSTEHADCLRPDCLTVTGPIRGEVRLAAAQHVRLTGHTVRVLREYVEEISPKTPPKATPAPLPAIGVAADRRAARKRRRR